MRRRSSAREQFLSGGSKADDAGIITDDQRSLRNPFMADVDVTQILAAAERGDRVAARDLLPLVYEELRRLAAQKVAQERVGHTLQATALVHEAYMRLVGDGAGAQARPSW